MGEIVVACIVFVISILMFILGYRSFREKGFLFNNAYLYASKEERETMDKSPHYRQSAICFLFIGILFFIIGLEAILHTGWLIYLEIVFTAAVIIYAIVSSIKIATKK